MLLHDRRCTYATIKEHEMHISSISLIASLVLLAVPASAQNSNMSTPARSSDPSTSTTSASQLPPDTLVTLDTQQKLKQSLEQSGFQKVLVTPSSYVIRAKAPDGSHIVMLVSPDQLHAIIEPAWGSSSAPGGSPSSGNGANR
jgi:hypothetical protein